MHSETRELILTLASANIQFATYPGETEEEIIPDKDKYGKGDKVGVFFKIANIGDIEAVPHLKIVDLDTGGTVKEEDLKAAGEWFPMKLKPGEALTLTAPYTVGSMPDHDWRLEFTITP